MLLENRSVRVRDEGDKEPERIVTLEENRSVRIIDEGDTEPKRIVTSVESRSVRIRSNEINTSSTKSIPSHSNDIASFVGCRLSAAEKFDALKNLFQPSSFLSFQRLEIDGFVFNIIGSVNGIGLHVQKEIKVLIAKLVLSAVLLMELQLVIRL